MMLLPGIQKISSHDIPLKRNIAISDGDHGKLKLLGRGTEGEKQSQDIVHTGVGVENNTLLGSHCDLIFAVRIWSVIFSAGCV